MTSMKHGLAATGFALLVLSAPARADVLQIDDDGARWVSGDRASMPAASTDVQDGSQSDSLSALFPLSAQSDQSRTATGIPGQYAAKVAELSQRFDLSPSLIEALVWQESRWRQNAVSPVGARGLAQLMPGTARDLGVDPHDAFQNLEGGARYLREQLDRFDGDLEKALAAYNAGPGRVIRAGGVPRIRETQTYVASIMGRLSNHSRQDLP